LTRRRGSDGVVLAVVAVAQFMVVLDVSIVNVALPSMRHDLGFSAIGLQWVVNAYTLTYAGFLLLGGRTADLFGRRRIFLLGVLVFTSASLVGGLAQDQQTLLVARALQGLGGAILSPATLTILTTTFHEPARRARALGIWSAMAGAGGATGALIGGLLTELVSWRWILFVNVPIGALLTLAAVAVLTESRASTARASLDLLGAVLVTAGLLVLVYGIVGTEEHGWTAPRTLLTIGVAILLLSAFVVHEGRFARAPLMPLGIWRVRSVSGGNLVMFFVAMAIFATWYFQTLYMQNVLGWSPLRTGLAFLPQSLGIVVGSQVSSRLVERFGARTLLVVGPLISATGLLWLAQLTPQTPYFPHFAVPAVMVTFGVGVSFTPIALSSTSGLPPNLAGLASGLVNTTRQVGASLGLAVLATLATSRTRSLVGAAGADAGAGGSPSPAVAAALTSGYAYAFGVAAAFALAAVAASFLLPRRLRAAADLPVEAEERTAA
jgi:EmrB/QacA subfamily drug resistance transporter